MLVVGVDVGGTNTDAVVFDVSTGSVRGKQKSATTADTATGITQAVRGALLAAGIPASDVVYVAIGTTHFLNAVLVQSVKLAKVAVLRLCGTATQALPPFVEFPLSFRKLVEGCSHMLPGGYEFTGDEISSTNQADLSAACSAIQAAGIRQVVVCGVYSPCKNAQEVEATTFIRTAFPQLDVTASHAIGNLGLLERENAAILNACLRPLAGETISAFQTSMRQLGFACPLYLTQNDGTLMTSERAKEFPVLTFAAGATNSMRGAAFLTGIKDGLVVDIGGTSTDVGILSGGFPRLCAVEALVAGVRTNFRMPEVLSIALGGGSVIERPAGPPSAAASVAGPKTGPESVAYALTEKALSFGGPVLTTTDIIVALRGVNVLRPAGDASNAVVGPSSIRAVTLEDVGGAEFAQACVQQFHRDVEALIDRVKTTPDAVPVILVGGGSILIGSELAGCSKLVIPPHFDVANAVGAAISQVSGNIDVVLDLPPTKHAELLEQLKEQAVAQAVAHGANRSTVEILSCELLPLAYMPGHMHRVTIKAIGGLCKVPSLSAPVSSVESSVPASSAHVPGGAVSAATPSPSAVSAAVEPVPRKQPPPLTRTVNIDEKTGYWNVTEQDLEYIAEGTGILGSGGGGTARLGLIRGKALLRSGRRMRVVDPNSIAAQDFFTPIGFIGAPFVVIEKLPNGREVRDAAEAAAHQSGVTGQGFLGAEVGGLNGIEPLLAAAETGLPCVDADLMGRAFPQVEMASSLIAGLPCTPTGLADDKGNRLVAAGLQNPKMLEKYMRTLVVSMGGMAGLALPPLSGEQIRSCAVLHSLSQAWLLGKRIIQAREAHQHVPTALAQHGEGRVIFMGKITAVERRTQGGFTSGTVTIAGAAVTANISPEVAAELAPSDTLVIEMQNEYLIARLQNPSAVKGVITLATTPDIISIVAAGDGSAINSEALRYGLRVAVVVLPAPKQMCSERALKVVGPQAFGYPDSYKPI